MKNLYKIITVLLFLDLYEYTLADKNTTEPEPFVVCAFELKSLNYLLDQSGHQKIHSNATADDLCLHIEKCSNTYLLPRLNEYQNQSSIIDVSISPRNINMIYSITYMATRVLCDEHNKISNETEVISCLIDNTLNKSILIFQKCKIIHMIVSIRNKNYDCQIIRDAQFCLEKNIGTITDDQFCKNSIAKLSKILFKRMNSDASCNNKSGATQFTSLSFMSSLFISTIFLLFIN